MVALAPCLPILYFSPKAKVEVGLFKSPLDFVVLIAGGAGVVASLLRRYSLLWLVGVVGGVLALFVIGIANEPHACAEEGLALLVVGAALCLATAMLHSVGQKVVSTSRKDAKSSTDGRRHIGLIGSILIVVSPLLPMVIDRCTGDSILGGFGGPSFLLVAPGFLALYCSSTGRSRFLWISAGCAFVALVFGILLLVGLPHGQAGGGFFSLGCGIVASCVGATAQSLRPAKKIIFASLSVLLLLTSIGLSSRLLRVSPAQPLVSTLPRVSTDVAQLEADRARADREGRTSDALALRIRVYKALETDSARSSYLEGIRADIRKLEAAQAKADREERTQDAFNLNGQLFEWREALDYVSEGQEYFDSGIEKLEAERMQAAREGRTRDASQLSLRIAKRVGVRSELAAAAERGSQGACVTAP